MNFQTGKVPAMAPVLLGVLCALSACGSTNLSDTGAATDMGGKSQKVKSTNSGGGSTTTTTPTSTPTSSTLVYDTSVGTGMDANGFALLPLRAGAHRYFVSSAAGSDGNGCSAAQQPGTPMHSIAAAVACIQSGNGDQVMVAEGTTYSEGLPNLDHQAGYNPQYPTVIQSYDPSDPTNEAKYGHASSGRRPVVNAGNAVTCCIVTPASFLAIRGFDVNPGNVPDQNVSFIGSNGLPNTYVLIENNIFRYTQLIVEGPDAAKGSNVVIRKNSIYGAWSGTAHAQGVYVDGLSSFTVEDNVFWHNGWKVGVSRDAGDANGGPTIFNHAMYQQTAADGVIRRNIFIDPSATGCSCRSNTSIQENVFIDNPIAIIGGEGTNYNTAQPNGVNIDIGYNAILGDADINTLNPRGGGIQTGNGKLGSAVHNNLIARSRNPSAVNVVAFVTQAGYNQPSYADIHDNLEYLWAAPGQVTMKNGSYVAQDLVTYENNAWSDPASSVSNVNSSTKAFPNAYTGAQLFAALGCTDKATCTAKMIETPELGWGVQARTLLWAGYGMK